MSADQKRLYLTYGVGDGCGRAFAGLHLLQTTQSVAIAALVISDGNHDSACATVLMTEDGYDLDESLGARSLIICRDGIGQQPAARNAARTGRWTSPLRPSAFGGQCPRIH